MRQNTTERGRGWDGALAALALTAIVALFLAAPGSLLDKADRVAYAVCHRIAERSFIFGGRPLPLCARCSGTYLGAAVAFVVLFARGRGRAGRLPGRPLLLVLGAFLALWAFDGLNSYLTLFPGMPHLYEPHNILRLITGMLEGLVIAAVMLPVVNLGLWREAAPAPSLAGWHDLLWLLVGGAAVVLVVNSEWAPLLYPLALLSGLMVVLLVGAINALGLLLLLRREGRATGWGELVAPILGGLALASLELAIIGIARDALTAWLGLPF